MLTAILVLTVLEFKHAKLMVPGMPSKQRAVLSQVQTTGVQQADRVVLDQECDFTTVVGTLQECRCLHLRRYHHHPNINVRTAPASLAAAMTWLHAQRIALWTTMAATATVSANQA